MEFFCRSLSDATPWLPLDTVQQENFRDSPLNQSSKNNHFLQLPDFVCALPIHAPFHNATRISCCSWPRPYPARHCRFWWDATAPRAADAIGRAAQTPSSRARMSRPDSWPPCYRRRPAVANQTPRAPSGRRIIYGCKPKAALAASLCLGLFSSGLSALGNRIRTLPIIRVVFHLRQGCGEPARLFVICRRFQLISAQFHSK